MFPGGRDDGEQGPGDRLAASVSDVSSDDPPDPSIGGVSVPDEIVLDESFEVTVDGRNNGGRGGNYSTITVSAPSLDETGDDDRVRVTDGTDHAYTQISTRGDQIYDSAGNEMGANYALAEGGSDNATYWNSGERRSLSVEFTPKETGTFILEVRVTLPDDDDQQQKYTAPSSSTHDDQQGFPIERYEVEVREEPDINATLRDVNIDSGAYSNGDTVDAEATVENTGNREHTFFLGYSVYGPNGDDYDNNDMTGTPVSLEPGEDTDVSLSWDVNPDAPDGVYDAEVAVWEESDRDNLRTRLEEWREEDAFEIEQEAITATITDSDPPSGAYSPGETVPAAVEVQNTGTTDHTFFVGYSVFGPEGGEYDNNDETGTPVTISEDDYAEVTVEWEVPDDVPSGIYDVYVAVWKESDRDTLETKLDDTRTQSAFTVDTTTDITAEITDREISSGEYATGEEVPATVTVENTSETNHTFFVGYTVFGPGNDEYDNDATTGTAVTIPQNTSEEVDVKWVVPSDAATGRYDANIVVWEESDRDNLQTELDSIYESDEFAVVDASADASLERVETASGSYTEGEVVPATVTVANTGETDHTFFVGYTVFGPENDEYDNNDTTGQQLSIAAGETAEVDVEWQVARQAPPGVYDVEVAVWAESDRDRLNTRLDDTRRRDVFEVTETVTAAELTDVQPPADPVVGGGTAAFNVTVENQGETDHTFFVELELRDEGRVVTDETIGRQVDLEDGVEQTTTIDWSVPEAFASGTYDVRVIVWSERDPENLQTTLTETDREDAVVIENPEITVSSLTFQPDDPIDSFDTTATASLTIRTSGDEPTQPTVEHRIVRPDETLIASETDTPQVRPGEDQTVEFQWEPTPDQDLANGAYTYEVAVFSETDKKLLTRRTDDAFTIELPGLGRTDFSIQVFEATGEAVSEADIEMSPADGGSGFTGQLQDGAVAFENIPGGIYEVTVDHGEAILEESFRTFVGGTATTQEYVVQPVDPISGSVVDSTGDQQLPNATVRLAGIEETATDGMGAYTFNTPVPDGEYDLVVESPGGSTTQETVSVGPDRHVALQTDQPLVPEDQRGQEPDAEVIGEANQLVTLVARYLQNADADDVINHYTDQAHGLVKGFVAGIVDLFEGFQAILDILNLELEKVIDALSALVGALVENFLQTVIELGAALLGSAVDYLESIHARQQQDNPYEPPNPRAYSFMSGWYSGFLVFAVLTSLIGGKIASTAGKILKNTNRFVDAIESVTSTIRRVDGDDKVSLTDGGRNMLAQTRRDRLSFEDGFDASGDIFATMTISQLLPDAPDPDFLRQMLKGAYYVNYRNRGFLRKDVESPGYTDPFEGLWGRDLTGGDVGSAVGRAMEMVYYGRAIETDFIDVHRVMSDFDPAKIPVGKRGIITSWRFSDDDFDVELDGVEIEMRQIRDGEPPKPVVTKVREITTYDTGDAPNVVRGDKREQIQEIIRRTNDPDAQTPNSGGLSGEAFVRGDWIDDAGELLEMVWWDQTLEANRDMVEETVKYIIRSDKESNGNAIRSLFDPEASNE